MPTIHLTRRTVLSLDHPERGQVLFRDNKLRGFGPRVGTRSKVYFAEGHLESSHPRYAPLGVSFWRRHFGKVDASLSALEQPYPVGSKSILPARKPLPYPERVASPRRARSPVQVATALSASEISSGRSSKLA